MDDCSFTPHVFVLLLLLCLLFVFVVVVVVVVLISTEMYITALFGCYMADAT